MSDEPREAADALARGGVSTAPKRLRPGCVEPGCSVPSEMAVYLHQSGGPACISHAADPSAKRRATAKGGDAATRRRLRALPPGTPDPDWSTPKAIRGWLEQRGGMIERGELDARVVPVKLAELAKQTHDSEALEKLDGLERLIKERLLR